METAELAAIILKKQKKIDQLESVLIAHNLVDAIYNLE